MKNITHTTAAEAAKVIAVAAAEAARVVAASATEALQASNKQRTEDHDLLVRVDEKVGGLKLAVDKLSDRDDDYVLKEEHKIAIDKLERDLSFWRNILISGLILSIFLGVIMNFIK